MTNQDDLAGLGEIAAEIAHELRNVLQVIATRAFVAKQRPEGAAKEMETIARQARLGQSIVDDVLALGRGDLAVEEFELARACEEARAELSAAIFFDEVPPALSVRGHFRLLVRLLHTLYENAIGAAGKGEATIVTRAAIVDGKIRIDVEDDGPGVPAEMAVRMFEPGVSGRPQGTGFGLALAKRICAAHRGSIALVPSSKGACLRIELPQ